MFIPLNTIKSVAIKNLVEKRTPHVIIKGYCFNTLKYFKIMALCKNIETLTVT